MMAFTAMIPSTTAKVTSYNATILREHSAEIALEFQGKKLFTYIFCELTTHVVGILCNEESRSNSGLEMCDGTQTISTIEVYIALNIQHMHT
jgi:hypothetical protein